MPDTYADKIARIKDLVSLATETKNIVVDHETKVNDFETRIATLESGPAFEIPGINCYHNAGSHNAIFRGKDLGTEVTTEQYAAINAGTFEGLYIGDFWNKTINIDGQDKTVPFRIADFDYYYGTGTNTHHMVIVPDLCFCNAEIETSNSDKRGYALSYMRSTGLNDAKTKINTAFGTSHILNYWEYLETTVDENGIVTRAERKNDCTVELMSETMVFGHRIVSPQPAVEGRHTLSKAQLSLFRLKPDFIKVSDGGSHSYWCLRDFVQHDTEEGTSFAAVSDNGSAIDFSRNTDAIGVRPCFLIH